MVYCDSREKIKNNRSVCFFRETGDKDYFLHDIRVSRFFRSYPSKYNILFRIFRKLKIDFMKRKCVYFCLKKIRYVVMFDSGYSFDISECIKKNDSEIKTILWFWNPINGHSRQFLDDKNLDEIWSYDKDDCKKYGLKYNTQFYSRNVTLPRSKIIYDVVFLGADKGRRLQINSINEELQNNGLKTKFVIPSKQKEYLKYEEYLKMVSQSKAILDFVNDGVTGLTLRPMESIFLEKKLITNNKDIKNYDFYNSQNIFILGEDDLSKLSDFLNKPYRKIDQKIVDYYDFEQWVKRFNLEDTNEL